MPFPDTLDPDEVIYAWLKSIYTAYRNALPNPDDIPLESDIDWNSIFSGARDTSFIVLDTQNNHDTGLGAKAIKIQSVSTVHIAYRQVGLEKPAILKRLKYFVVKSLHENASPPPAIFTTNGIAHVIPLVVNIAGGGR